MFWLTLLSVGVQSNKSIWRKTFFRIYYFRHRRKDSWEKFFEIFGKNYQWGFTRMLEKSFHFIKIRFNENKFSWIVFERHFYQWEYREMQIEKKKYFSEKARFHWNLFSLKNFDWFGMVHQWVFTRMMIKLKKNLWRKNLHWVFFQKRVLSNINISGSTECHFLKKKNSFPSNFFGYREIFSRKT